jgi:hypothetical protein
MRAFLFSGVEACDDGARVVGVDCVDTEADSPAKTAGRVYRIFTDADVRHMRAVNEAPPAGAPVHDEVVDGVAARAAQRRAAECRYGVIEESCRDSGAERLRELYEAMME